MIQTAQRRMVNESKRGSVSSKTPFETLHINLMDRPLRPTDDCRCISDLSVAAGVPPAVEGGPAAAGPPGTGDEFQSALRFRSLAPPGETPRSRRRGSRRDAPRHAQSDLRNPPFFCKNAPGHTPAPNNVPLETTTAAREGWSSRFSVSPVPDESPDKLKLELQRTPHLDEAGPRDQ